MTETSTPPDTRVDLTNCDREPIHQLGRVQSYGALLAVSSDWIVQHGSENLEEILGSPLEAALGQPLSSLIVPDGFDRMRANLRQVHAENGVVRLFNVALRSSGAAFDVSMHQSGAHLIVEFEPKVERSGQDVMAEIYPKIAALRTVEGLDQLAREAARSLAQLSGFDSVMVYQFQPDHSGKVIAETRRDGEERYRGLCFPASDIPVQARQLYTRSLLRLIADVADEGSPISPGHTLDGALLDLSLAVTRAVSPIHIEYLKNMGVEASMSVSIMKDGALWGLFACHHDSPRYIDYERRTAVELFAHLFSYEISRQEDGARKQVELESAKMQSLLMAHMADGTALSQSLMETSDDIRSVIDHDGLVLIENDELFTHGTTPSQEQVRALARRLDRALGASVYHTDEIAKLHEDARDYDHKIAGMLAIPISKRPRDYLILFRKPIVETVSWAGNPEKPVSIGPNGVRLTPRKSFDVWRETVGGRSRPWTDAEIHAADLLRTTLLEVYLKVTDAANLERKRAHEQQQLLISELNHRVRNILNLMGGLIAQSRSSARTLEEFTANLDGRIHSLARAHDQLTSEQWEPASLKTLIKCEFEAYADAKKERVTIIGPDAMITPNGFTTMALVLHEMATNSIKYGALCDQSGKVHITLTEDSSGGLLIDWIERGGPPVTPPKRRGFGTVIIENSLPHELNGDASVDYKITGVEAHFRLPPTEIAEIRRSDQDALGTPPDAARQDCKLSGQGLVLEDTLVIAMDAADILKQLGASKVKIASSVTAALEWLENNDVAFALLDVNLGSEQSVPVAECLAERNVPFVLATGYGASDDLIKVYPPCVIVQKPFTDAALETAFSDALSKTGISD